MSDAPLPVYQAGDFYVPRFEVKLGNRQQKGDLIRDVIQVTYKDSVEEIDNFELTVNNWDAEARKFKYSDRALFNTGQEVELRMGYLGQGEMRTMIRGEITGLKPSFPSSGQPTLAVSGLNVLHRLRKEQKSDRYEGLTFSQIAERICGRLPVRFIKPQLPTPETPLAHLIQDNQYDLLFLLALAREVGYELLVKEDSEGPAVTFGEGASSDRVTYRLSYGRSLIDFQPTLSTANQVSEVVVRGWDAAKGEEIEETANQGSLAGSTGLANKVKVGTPPPAKDRKEVIGNRAVRDRQEARDLARATLARINSELVKANGSVVGLPSLRAGSDLAIDGLGLRFNGRYFVTATTHTIGTSGYVTQFECKLVELSHRSGGEAL